MATIISTKTSSVGGLSVTGDASGILQLASADGTTALTINASQNVGIGTSSPLAKLQIGDSTANIGNRLIFGRSVTCAESKFPLIGHYSDGSTSDLALAATSTSGNIRFFTGNNTSQGEIATGSNTEKMRIDSAGNVGIGTSIPSNKLSVGGNPPNNGTIGAVATAGGISLALSDNINNSLYVKHVASGVATFGTDSGGQIAFGTNGFTERMRLDASGNLLVGTTSQFGSGKVCVSYDGTVYNGVSLRTTNAALNSNFVTFYNSATTNCGGISQNGTTTVNYITSSDYRLKENIIPIVGALDKVVNLNPVTYIWKDTDNEVGEGFIAHELQAICPLAVSGEKDAVNEDGSIKAQGIDPSKLVATLTAAIQELKAIIDTQNARITTLEGG